MEKTLTNPILLLGLLSFVAAVRIKTRRGKNLQNSFQYTPILCGLLNQRTRSFNKKSDSL
jgi:hypothetical protein